MHAENSWPLKQYKNATVVLKSSEENGSGEIMFETELLTVFNALKLNASISGDDEDTFDVLSELESAMDDLLSLAPEMLETELEFDVYATNKTSCQRECAKANHCCNYDESRGSNQKLSCLQACLVRVSGVSKSECDASCITNGCSKFDFSLCTSCNDVPAHSSSSRVFFFFFFFFFVCARVCVLWVKLSSHLSIFSPKDRTKKNARFDSNNKKKNGERTIQRAEEEDGEGERRG